MTEKKADRTEPLEVKALGVQKRHGNLGSRLKPWKHQSHRLECVIGG